MGEGGGGSQRRCAMLYLLSQPSALNRVSFQYRLLKTRVKTSNAEPKTKLGDVAVFRDMKKVI